MYVECEMDQAQTMTGDTYYKDAMGPCHLGIARLPEETYRIVHATPITLRNELIGLAGIAVDGRVSLHTQSQVEGTIQDIYNNGAFYTKKEIKREFRNAK